MTQERGLDNNQLLRARAVFEKLGAPSNEFYLEVRNASTHQNTGTNRREGGISVMMPYQYYYHRLRATKHNKYPSYMDATDVIGPDRDNPDYNMLSRFAEKPEDIAGISQTMWSRVDEARLASFERFAARITQEWEEYQAKTKPAEELSSPVAKVSYRGLSVELIAKLPHLEVMHFCASVALICDLKRGAKDDQCIQMRQGSITSRSTENGWETTEIWPEPAGCKVCPLTGTS